ncbi:MAG TPA: hypothetical protein VF517_17120 [Thermoleophilaceae bacterium]|jgi:hypothetical protein
MREPRNQFAKIADTITGWSNRRQRSREPRVLVYDTAGHPRLVRPESDAHDGIVEVAEQLVALTTAEPPAEAGGE